MGQAAEKLAAEDRAEPEVASDPFRVREDALLRHAAQIAREHPEHLASLGLTAEQYARELAQPGMSIEASVEAGWMSAAEGRFLLGQATLADLIELGHSPDEARTLLQEQQELACASSD